MAQIEIPLLLTPSEPLGFVELATPAFSPLYQQIKALMLQSLQSGEWKPGEAIPSEMDLAARFRVSQGTMRKAIDELAAKNLLIRRQGKGTFVATHAETQVQYRFLKLVPDAGDQSSEGPADRHIVECKRIRASSEIAKLLNLRTGDPVLQAQRVLSFGGIPTILEDIWLPGGPFKGLTAERLAQYNGPMYALFETEFGVRMVRATENIRAIQADATHTHKGKNGNVRFCEFSEKSLFRRLELSESVDVNRVTASLDQGILQVTAPKATLKQMTVGA